MYFSIRMNVMPRYGLYLLHNIRVSRPTPFINTNLIQLPELFIPQHSVVVQLLYLLFQ